MLIGLLIVALDLALIAGLIAAIVVAAFWPRRAWSGAATFWRWTTIITLLAVLGFVVLGNVRFLVRAYDQGRPSAAQVEGTWTDSGGAALHVLPDGTFTAAGLPADANDPAGDGKPHPAGGHGTWQITRGDGTWVVLFTLSGGSRFRLDGLWRPASPGGAPTAWFTWVFTRYNAVDLWAFYRR